MGGGGGGIGGGRRRIAAARCGISSRRRIRTGRRRIVGARLRITPIVVVGRLRIAAIVVVGRLRVTAVIVVRRLRTLRLLVRAASIGRSWPVTVVVRRRGPRGLAARGSSLRTGACPWRTICIIQACSLRGCARGTIGASETRRRGVTLEALGMEPGRPVIAGAL